MIKKNILIIEDEIIISLSIKKWLEPLGCNIIGIVTKGEDAIDFVKDIKPDLIIADIVLNGQIDGISAIETINSEMKIPTIYITAFSEKFYIERAEKTNPFGYLVKPINPFDLCDLVSSAINNSNEIY